MKTIFYIIVSVLLMAASCKDTYQKDHFTTKKEETRGVDPVKAEYLPYHVDDNLTKLFFRFSSKDLIYSKTGSDNFTCDVKISWRVFSWENDKVMLDSGTVKITDINNENETKEIKGEIDLKLNHGGKYRLKMRLTDTKKDITTEDELIVDKLLPRSRQNYKVYDAEQGNMFYHYFPSVELLRIESKRNSVKPMTVRYYNKEFIIAPPPYSDFKFQQFSWKADSVFTVRIDDSGFVELKTKKKGFYHCQTDTVTKEGLTLFRFEKNYPRITTADALVEPLRYLTTGEEYKTLNTAKDKKVAVDDFWLDRCGSRERAKEIIRLYYGRVEDANRKYASYIEGWKTDRGMIYIIFGTPKYVDKTNDSETWFYGDRYSSQSVRFDFLKVNNPFSDNDYYLQRLGSYKPKWHLAVDAWRSGRAYVHER